jgi:uncharacterized alpha-E superfamily protein
MLSRVADSLYWLGRYLERAENVARLLIVANETAVELEGLNEELAQNEWDDLLAAVPGCEGGGFGFSREEGLALPYVRWLLLDDANPVSVRHSLARARDNARSVREALTKEVFGNLNEVYRELDRSRRRAARDPVAAEQEVVRIHGAILTTLGAMEHTMSRDQGWSFMKLGEALERAQRTLLVLRAKLPVLAQEGGADLPLFYARWRGLLRSVASLENYRGARGGQLDPEQIARFLLFDRVAPRSVLCGVNRIRGYLDRLPGGQATSEADRLLGRLHAALNYDDDTILTKSDLPGFCAQAADSLTAAHEAIAREYFPS